MRLVAASYKLAPVSDPAALPAFHELARKMARQNDFLRHDYYFIPSSGDHYSSLKQLRRSIDAQRMAGKWRADMFVYVEPPGPEGDVSQCGHPVFNNDQNVMIRGVHDAIAHLGGNHPFSARGEYEAYNTTLLNSSTFCNSGTYGIDKNTKCGIVSIRRGSPSSELTDRWRGRPLRGEMTSDQGVSPSRRGLPCSSYRFAPGSSTPPPSSRVSTAT